LAAAHDRQRATASGRCGGWHSHLWVTTGFGSNCGVGFGGKYCRPWAGLLRFHGCGTGPALPVPAVRGAMLCRVLCLMLGYSGVRPALVRRLVDFLNRGITPVVPAQGSVGHRGPNPDVLRGRGIGRRA